MSVQRARFLTYGRADPARRLQRPERLSPATTALYIVEPKVVGRGKHVTPRSKQMDLNDRLHARNDVRSMARVEKTLEKAIKAPNPQQQGDQHSIPYDEMTPEQAAAEIERLRDRRDAERSFLRTSEDWLPHLSEDEQDKVLAALRLHLDGRLSHKDWMKMTCTYRDRVHGPTVQPDYMRGYWSAGSGGMRDGF